MLNYADFIWDRKHAVKLFPTECGLCVVSGRVGVFNALQGEYYLNEFVIAEHIIAPCPVYYHAATSVTHNELYADKCL